MSPISTHVIDVAQGRPAAGVDVALDVATPEGAWRTIGQGATDADGRVKTLLTDGAALSPGEHRLTFFVAGYFERQGTTAFYRSIAVTFVVASGQSHYHVPLLLSPFGYSTYRGA